MSVVSRSLVPVSMRDGKCPSDEWHFRGATREVYSYLKLLAKRHGGFVFASVRDIAEHTKNWRKGQEQYSQRQCKRILRMFRELGVLGERCTRTIHNRLYHGRQFMGHDWWAESCGDICDFRRWEKYESQHQEFMGHYVTPVVTSCDTEGDTEAGVCVTLCVTGQSDISNDRFVDQTELQERAAC